MSLANVLFDGRGAAYVCVDTRALAIRPNEKEPKGIFEASKMLHLPAASTVFAVRGDGTLLRWVFNHYATHLETLDYDSITRTIKEVVREQFDGYRKHQRLHGLANAVGDGTEIHVVGWSVAQDRPAGVSVLASEEIEGLVREVPMHPKGMACPPFDAKPEASDLHSDVDYLRWMALQQVSGWTDRNIPIGGRLLVAKITRGIIVFQDLGSIGEPPAA